MTKFAHHSSHRVFREKERIGLLSLFHLRSAVATTATVTTTTATATTVTATTASSALSL